jgi:hypothetical protein
MPPLPDLDHLRLPPSATAPRSPRSRPPRHRPQSAFLKGPIPWDWLDRAGRLPGKALAVGLVLWQKAGLCNSQTIGICQARLDALGLREASLGSSRPGQGPEGRLLEAIYALGNQVARIECRCREAQTAEAAPSGRPRGGAKR